MSEPHDVFEKRLNLLTQRHRALANGYTASIRDDGLIIVEPKRARRKLPLRAGLIALAGFLAFKTVMLILMGDVTYLERVDLLSQGTFVERMGAWFMQVDPITQLLTDQLRGLLLRA